MKSEEYNLVLKRLISYESGNTIRDTMLWHPLKLSLPHSAQGTTYFALFASSLGCQQIYSRSNRVKVEPCTNVTRICKRDKKDQPREAKVHVWRELAVCSILTVSGTTYPSTKSSSKEQ